MSTLTVPELVVTESSVPTAVRWLGRYVASVFLMAVWLGIVLTFLPFLLPDPTPPDEADVGRLIFSNLHANSLLGVITGIYYVTLLPMLLLPMRESDRLTWFLFTAYGWMAAIFGSVAYLILRDSLVIGFPSWPLAFPAMQGVIAAMFLVPALLGGVFAPSPGQKKQVVIALVVGWILLQGGTLAIVQLWSMAHKVEGGIPGYFERTPGLLATLLAASALYVVVVGSIILPQTAMGRSETLGFMVLLWLFSLAAFLCMLVYRGRVDTVGDSSWEVFVCLVWSAFVGPFFGWLGANRAQRERAGWCVCLLLAGVTVFWAATLVSFQGSENVLRQVYFDYDGPRLIRLRGPG